MIKEIVPEHSNKAENQAFFIGVLVIVMVATGLLSLTQRAAHSSHEMPHEISNLATQLSVAGDEIAMLQEMELVSAPVTLSALIDKDIAPFSAFNFVEGSAACFVVNHAQALVRLKKSASGEWVVQWKPAGHAGDTLKADNSEQFCLSDSTWLDTTSHTEHH